MSWNIKNFKDWITTVLGVAFLVASLIVAIKTQLIIGQSVTIMNVAIVAILALFGFALMGIPTPDWVHELIKKEKEDK